MMIIFFLKSACDGLIPNLAQGEYNQFQLKLSALHSLQKNDE